ncbi:hypothetical protein Cva_01624 [Caedimonas varicaedens]|uniref:Uncharacterized protein n=1 Tax=Caedimonas varicaedens TaxID=1629334 RepID=A0A0K8MGH0_9PROT|nr:hypothetical protein Cva_01624 [Caedimonas varicaedens]
MPSVSSYSFQTLQASVLIQEAYERIGIAGEMTERQKVDSALRSLNFLLSQWATRGVHLWTLKTCLLPLIAGQRKLTLPLEVKKIVSLSLRTSYRILGGSATSDKEGDPTKAFDGDDTTACLQTAENGTITYTYPAHNPQRITLVGISSNENANYTLTIKGLDQTGHSVPLLTLARQTYKMTEQGKSLVHWAELPSPDLYQGYSLQETGGATLKVRELYLNQGIRDTVLTELSRSEYDATPTKDQRGRPCSFYSDRQREPCLYLWPTPVSSTSCLVMTYEEMMPDVLSMGQFVDIPARFYEAVLWGLAYQLSCKYKPALMEQSRALAEEAFRIATDDDTESTPVTLYPDDGGGR